MDNPWKKATDHYEPPLLWTDLVDVQWLDEHPALEESGVKAQDVNWANVRFWRRHEAQPAVAAWARGIPRSPCSVLDLERAKRALQTGEPRRAPTVELWVLDACADAARLAREGWTPASRETKAARQVVLEFHREKNGDHGLNPDWLNRLESGDMDDEPEVKIALAAIHAARNLESPQ